MKQTIFSLILIFLSIVKVSSQYDYKSGFIIDKKGDTTYGFIKDLNQIKIGNVCWFKKSKEVDAISYSPKDIIAFRFTDGKYYVSKLINVNKISKPLFLEYLVNGKANLYYRKDELGEHYYIQNKNDSLFELLNSETKIDIDGVHYTRNRNEYIGTIKILFKNCPEIQTEIDKSNFSHEDLINLAKDYHNYVCKDTACIIYVKDIKPKTSISYFVGIYNSHFDFLVKDNRFNFMNKEKFKPTITYSTGILISERNIFGLNDNYEFNFIMGFKNSTFKSDSIKIAQQNLYMPIYFTYYFPTGKLRPLLNFGFINTIYVNSDVFEPNEEYKNYLKEAVGVYDFGVLAGIGFEFKINKISYLLNLNFELRTEGINTTDYENNYLGTSIYELGLSFVFKYDLN